MRLYGEILRGANVSGARYTVVVGGGGYFEGVKTVGDFSPEKIVVHFPRFGVEICGEKLAIKKYCDGDLELSGKIYETRLLGDKESPERRG
ncbi:MAG: YabP/YqfC family sporulation protein [Clostridia bacterium]|nr:YabP/YqfC family sporulation protein [Clostridia bacterium]